MADAPSGDRRALEEERDFLLQSIRDLDVELAAGDIDPADHRELHDGYTVRAATVLRALAAEEAPAAKSSTQDAGGLGRRVGIGAGLAAFAVAAGLLLAQFAGERGASDALTGSIDESIREMNLRCQQLGANAEMQAALTCFDELLLQDPQNVEALTWKGWYLVLTVGSAQEAGEDELADRLIVVAQDSLQQAVDIDPNYAPARAFRAVVFERQGDLEATCAELALLDAVGAPPMVTQLTAGVAERAGCQP